MDKKSRFEIVTAQITDLAGVTTEHSVLVDRTKFRWVDTGFGEVVVGTGYLRFRGKQFIGNFGTSPVYSGGAAEIYYLPVSYLDGEWSYPKANSRGLYDAVTAGSGTGRLFADLERFAASLGLGVEL